MKKALLFFSLSFSLSTLFGQVQLVKDIRPGVTGSTMADLKLFNDKIYFRAHDGVSGVELWKTDGTTDGTALVKDLNSGSGFGYFLYGYVAGNKMFYTATDGTSGYEPFVVTQDDQVTLVADIKAGTSASTPNYYTALGTDIYFTATNSAKRLYKYDGTNAPQIVENTLTPGAGVAALNGKIIFSAGTSSSNFQLYSYDPSSNTATLLKTINSSANAAPTAFYVYNNKLYFSAIGTEGKELWISDGTENGTYLLKDINASGDSYPNKFYAYNGKIYFAATDGVNGTELWVTDGTTDGTKLFKDIAIGTESSVPGAFAELNGKLYFSASDLTDGTNTDLQLWETDGTESGTKKVTDINPDGDDKVDYIVSYKDKLYFAAVTSSTGQELFSYSADLSGIKNEKNREITLTYDSSKSKIIFSEDVDNYQLFNLAGKIISSGKVNNSTVSVNLSSGIYIMQLEKNNQLMKSKLIVNK